MYGVDSLRQLAMKFLERDELANYTFQNDFLRPFVVIMRHSKAVEIRELIIRCGAGRGGAGRGGGLPVICCRARHWAGRLGAAACRAARLGPCRLSLSQRLLLPAPARKEQASCLPACRSPLPPSALPPVWRRCVSQMVLARVANVKSGWKTMFMVFTTAASDESPQIVRLAFETIEKIVREYFHYITGGSAGAGGRAGGRGGGDAMLCGAQCIGAPHCAAPRRSALTCWACFPGRWACMFEPGRAWLAGL